MLHHSGKLLVRVKNQPFQLISAPTTQLTIPKYSIQPLFPAFHQTLAFSTTAPQDHWMVAHPAENTLDQPWDLAHAAAKAANYVSYIEPDLLHEAKIPIGALVGEGMDRGWPPHVSVSPGWHLGKSFSDFATAHNSATGNGIRIAHLDTGYTPAHFSTPRHVRRDLGYNFYEGNNNTTDPGLSDGLLLNPFHGTATLALLAGGAVNLMFQGQSFIGDIGGAPSAEIVPVRISPSVVHLYTSTMASGLDWALAPLHDTANRCDVVSISHGGLPSLAWADAVNRLYEAGIVVVAASGDNYYEVVIDLVTRHVVYPSAFNRVITAVGNTYDNTPYVTNIFNEMEGNWGPDNVMRKAIAGYCPNVVWMNCKKANGTEVYGFDMNGAGTSASTPQIAAACALWLEKYGAALPNDWQRVEACRLALFTSASAGNGTPAYLGTGILNASAMLDPTRSQTILDAVKNNQLIMMGADDTSFPFFRTLFGFGPPGSEQDRMYDTEAAQIVHRSSNADLVNASQEFANTGKIQPGVRNQLQRLFKAEPNISNTLQTYLP